MRQRTCAISGERFEVSDSDAAFYEKVSPVLAGGKRLIPAPSLSPLERQRRRLSLRNVRHLFQRTCDLSGRRIISCYRAGCGHTVYHADAWWSDNWDALQYGRDFDFSRPFFEQFGALYRDVPLIHLYQTPNENCSFVNGASNCKSCYLSFLMDYCEDCYYLTNGKHCRSCMDCLALTDCELCYESVDCSKCYNLAHSTRCSDCSDSWLLTDCRQCRCCIGCVNLVGREYYLFNEKSTRGEYEAYRTALGSAAFIAQAQNRAELLARQAPKRYYFGRSNDSFSGDALQNTKNAYHCFDSFELENCKYCNYVFHAHDCMDVNFFGDQAEWLYECLATGLSTSHNAFCMLCWSGSSFNLYCHLVSGCAHCFGCSGLRQKQYCIFNKQYTREEYEALAARIIDHMQKTGEWGEFFPSSMSPFAFNLSQAQEYRPLSREETARRGLRWYEAEAKAVQPQRRALPGTIAEASEELLREVLCCESCRNNYKLIGQELELCKRLGVPVRQACPECRHKRREARRNPRLLREAACSKCGGRLETTWRAAEGLRICCERCYRDEVC